MADARTSQLGESSGFSSAQNSLVENDALTNSEDLPRRTTPLEANASDDLLWYMRLLSECKEAWTNVCVSWRRRDCWSKLDAIFSFVCLPLRVLTRAASPHDRVTIPDHASVSYLFLLMCYTFVINLVRVNENKDKRRDYFVDGCMILAIGAMLYIYLFTKNRVLHDPCHDASIRIFFRGGLYIFGFASIVNSICLAVDEWKCKKHAREIQRSAATVQVLKAIFIVVETLFLGYFHKARFPLDTAFLQISLAHILGTNLSLWFWTLYEEAAPDPVLRKCTNKPLDWGEHLQKYFYPVFVEYLILAATILYELWSNLANNTETLCRHCEICASCHNRIRNTASDEENNSGERQSNSQRRRYIPRCGFGIMIGTIYVALFLVLMLLAIYEAKPARKHKNYDETDYFQAYCYGSFILYLSQISTCYIILASLRSGSKQRIRSIDYDDVLLYISLMGILLLEGFHLVSKIKADRHYFHLVIVDVSGTVQHLTQTVTLINLRHFGSATSRRNRTWICECILFLILTNIAWWIEDSFYLEPNLTRPGEIKTIEGISTYGYIVKPMVIFFRFHSATYFYNAWTIYKV